MKINTQTIEEDLKWFQLSDSKIQNYHYMNQKVKNQLQNMTQLQYENNIFKKFCLKIDQYIHRFQCIFDSKNIERNISNLNVKSSDSFYNREKLNHDELIDNVILCSDSENSNNEQENLQIGNIKMENSNQYLYYKILGQYDFTNLDIQCLCEERLNDKIINFFAKFISDRYYYQYFHKVFPSIIHPQQFFIFNTFFSMIINDFSKKKYKKIQLQQNLSYIWQKDKFNLTQKKYIFFPIHFNENHWNMFCVKGFNKLYRRYHNRHKDRESTQLIFYFFDSLPCELIEVLYNALLGIIEIILNGFLKLRAKHKQIFVRLEDSQHRLIQVEVPQQKNQIDCGVYLLENIERTIQQSDMLQYNHKLNYTSHHIKLKRNNVYQAIKDLFQNDKSYCYNKYLKRVENKSSQLN